MSEIEKSRMQLEQYDPFPLLLDQERQIDDFVFSIQRQEIEEVRYGRTYKIKKHFFSIKDLSTNEERIVNISNVDYGDSEIDTIKAIMISRKKLSFNKLLWGLNVTKKYNRNGRTISDVSDFKNRYMYNLYFCNKERNRYSFHKESINYKELDLDDDFIYKLKTALEKDKKEWSKRKKENKTNLNVLQDTIRTNELMKLFPKFKQLAIALDHFNSSGMEYSMEEIKELERALSKVNNTSYLFVTLRKYCNKKK